jgi:capsular polysaccharide biosynthesis protein
VNDPNDKRGLPLDMDSDLPERLWDFGDHAVPEGHPAADAGAGLVSMSYIKAELRRHARLWCLTAVLGLLVGCGLYLRYPPSYTATATVLLKAGPNQNPAVQIETDAALLQSNGVAAGAIKQLGIQLPPSTLQANYNVTVLTSETILLNMQAPSGTEAVQRATAITSSFLNVFDSYAQIGLQQTQDQLNQQVAEAQQKVDTINKEISQVISQAPGSASQPQLNGLHAQLTIANDALLTVQQYATDTLATTQTGTAAEVHGSQVLDAATLQPHSHIKKAALYVVGGLVGGLAVGVIIVVLMALLTERLRRRDDVGEALDAPIGLSVGPLRSGRLGVGRTSARITADRTRVSEYLAKTIPQSPQGTAALCIIAVDNVAEVTDVAVEFAQLCAHNGRTVMVADLCAGAPTARALGATGTGLSAITLDGAKGVVVVPDTDEIAPLGPRRADRASGANDELLRAYDHVDLLLTIALLDPAVGAEHLVTWASDAVAIVTAGRSTATRLRAVSGMIKLSGTRLTSVVLASADKSDESLGRTDWQDQLARRSPV